MRQLLDVISGVVASQVDAPPGCFLSRVVLVSRMDAVLELYRSQWARVGIVGNALWYVRFAWVDVAVPYDGYPDDQRRAVWLAQALIGGAAWCADAWCYDGAVLLAWRDGVVARSVGMLWCEPLLVGERPVEWPQLVVDLDYRRWRMLSLVCHSRGGDWLRG